jgi:2-polyprenyl-6-methoxyphenol hydroxylase-like FAD-dependent oxidoreductase
MKALIIGAGIGGMSAAIALRGVGIEVDMIDIDPQWRVYGAGITITGPTLRAFHALGVYDEIARKGYVGEGIRVCNISGDVLHDIATPMPPGSIVASSGGIMRPVLHRILSTRIERLRIDVRLGVSANRLNEDENAIDVEFSDGSSNRYDLVVGADGIYSRTRSQILADAPIPYYTGQSVWRIVTGRPAWVDRRHYFLGGPHKVGFTPVTENEMYVFINERTQREVREPHELYEGMRNLLEPYGGIIADIRARLTPQSEIVFRPLEALSFLPPWHSGRVVLIGDAAHPTTPQLASGAGIAVEDALVLAQELAAADTITDAFASFSSRREERCRLVVDSSIEIGRLEQTQAPASEQTTIVDRVLAKLMEPI